MVLISPQYDRFIGWVHKGAIPVFIPVEVDGRSRLYQSVIVPTPSQGVEIRQRPNQFVVAAVDAIRGCAVEDGYLPEE